MLRADDHLAPEAPAATRARGGGYLVSPDLQVRCVTPGTGAPRPPGEPGELQFRGYNVFSCYPGNPAATAASMTADGWFRSGDLGQVQPDGAFIYLARLKDSLRLGGYLVGPKRSRNSCRNTPRSRPPTWSACGGSRRATCRSPSVRLRPGARADETELLGFLRHRMASCKVPRRVLFVDEFPSADSANGRKIQKNRLREIARERLED